MNSNTRGKISKITVEKYIPGDPGVPATQPTPAIPANPGQPYKAGYYKTVWVDEPQDNLPNVNTNSGSNTTYNNNQTTTQKVVYLTGNTQIFVRQPNTIYIYIDPTGSLGSPFVPLSVII